MAKTEDKNSYPFIEIGRSILTWSVTTDKTSLGDYLRETSTEKLSFPVLCYIARLLERNLQTAESLSNKMDCCGRQLNRIEKRMPKKKKTKSKV